MNSTTTGIDWSLIGTYLGIAASVIVPICLAVINAIRQRDLKMIKDIESRITDVASNVQAKLDRQEHQFALARIDKEMDMIRRDQREDFAKIEGRMDRIDGKLDRILERVVTQQ